MLDENNYLASLLRSKTASSAKKRSLNASSFHHDLHTTFD